MIKKISYVIFIMLILCSCDGNYEYVSFEEPQPTDSKPLRKIPARFQGVYESCSDTNDFLIIGITKVENKVIVFSEEIIDVEGVQSTGWKPSTSGESLTEYNDGSSVFRVFDTTGMHKNTINYQVFETMENQVMKKSKNNLFFNYRENEIWNVVKFEFRNDSLFIGRVTPNDNLLKHKFVSKEVIENKEDSTTVTRYHIKPSKKEFIKLFVPNSFKTTECYRRVNQPVTLNSKP